MYGGVDACESLDSTNLHLQDATVQHLHDALGRHRCRLCRFLRFLFGLRSRLGSSLRHGVHTLQGGRVVAMLCAGGGEGEKWGG